MSGDYKLRCRKHSGTLDFDGFLLRYRIEGQGLPTIVIGSVNQYPPMFSEKLRQELQLIFIDHRAFVPAPVCNPDSSTVDFDT